MRFTPLFFAGHFCIGMGGAIVGAYFGSLAGFGLWLMFFGMWCFIIDKPSAQPESDTSVAAEPDKPWAPHADWVNKRPPPKP